jgi:hypothetical protein
MYWRLISCLKFKDVKKQLGARLYGQLLRMKSPIKVQQSPFSVQPKNVLKRETPSKRNGSPVS